MLVSSLNRSVAWFAVVFLSLLAGGCVRTTQPILKDEQVISNDALLGKWVAGDGKSSGELTAGEGGKYRLTYFSEDGKSGHFLVRFGKIADVSVAEISPDAFTSGMSDEFKAMVMPLYTMVVIEKTGPQLVLAAPALDWMKKYILSHPDELDVNNIEDLVIQSSTDDFQAVFSKHHADAGMLGDPAIFVRPGDPSTQPAAGAAAVK
jgi:hypothetical protein